MLGDIRTPSKQPNILYMYAYIFRFIKIFIQNISNLKNKRMLHMILNYYYYYFCYYLLLFIIIKVFKIVLFKVPFGREYGKRDIIYNLLKHIFPYTFTPVMVEIFISYLFITSINI